MSTIVVVVVGQRVGNINATRVVQDGNDGSIENSAFLSIRRQNVGGSRRWWVPGPQILTAVHALGGQQITSKPNNIGSSIIVRIAVVVTTHTDSLVEVLTGGSELHVGTPTLPIEAHKGTRAEVDRIERARDNNARGQARRRGEASGNAGAASAKIDNDQIVILTTSQSTMSGIGRNPQTGLNLKLTINSNTTVNDVLSNLIKVPVVAIKSLSQKKEKENQL